MRIVNGRVGEDQGPFTFISRNGASVVCYVKNVISPISRVLMYTVFIKVIYRLGLKKSD